MSYEIDLRLGGSVETEPPISGMCVYGHWYSVMSWQYIRGMDCGLVSHVPCVLWVCCLVWHPVSLVLRSTLCLSCLSAPTGPSFLRGATAEKDPILGPGLDSQSAAVARLTV